MVPYTYTASVDITTRIVDLQPSDLCKATKSDSISPQSTFTIEVRDEDGVVPSVSLELSLEIDPD